MGLLHQTSSSIVSFKKAVLSVWFQVPTETFTEIFALTDTPEPRWEDGFNGIAFYPPMYKVIPLLTFGSLETTIASSSVGSELPISPSFIGIDCDGDSPALAVNLQLPNTTSFSGTPQIPGLEYRPSCFYMGGGVGLPNSTEVVGDQWHNALISFDLTDSCSCYQETILEGSNFVLTGGPKFTWALNDVDKVGSAMRPSGGENWSGHGDLSDDDIIPSGLTTVMVGGDEGMTATWNSTAITSFGNPIGTPASIDWIANNLKVRMAHIQLFTDVYLDFTVEANRRAFITSEGIPATPVLAASLLEKQPEVHFLTESDWLTGNNRGTAGNFTREGTINSFSPGP